VLIVDADEPFRKTLYRVIRRAGYRTAVARDETEALQKTARNHFPLILIDLWQANRNAVSLVQQMRSASPVSQIVVITPFDANEFCAELAGLEIFECVRKPVKRSSLLEVVSRALSGAKNSDPELRTPPANHFTE
jgi:DNA-binding NtrC family response regulator